MDHPRTCGEKSDKSFSVWSLTGSPPHMRGKVKRNQSSRVKRWDHPRTCGEKSFGASFGTSSCRITPAHAGKRVFSALWLFSVWDHPRTCGEKRFVPCWRPVSAGITPAHAGKRLKRSRSIVPHAAIVPLFPSVCNKPAGSDGSPAGHDAPPFLPIENAAPASPAYNLRSL